MTQGSPKRYLVITELFLPTKGGTAVWFDEVYRRIGDDTTCIITADVPGSLEHDANHPNTVHRIRLRRHWWLRPESLAMYVKFLGTSLLVGLRRRFDAVHAGRVLPEGLIGWFVARVTRRSIVIYAHGEEITTWRQPVKYRFMRFAYRHADRVVANSDFTRAELLKLGVVQARIVLISPGVDVARYTPGLPCDDLKATLDLADDAKLILSVGRLSRRKGFDQVIRAVPELLKNNLNVHYAVIGIGEDNAYLAELADECGVASRVHFLGHISMEDLPRWYNAADVFAMPNRDINGDTEGFGMVFMEAAACGCPALAGISGGTGSAVVHGETGLRVDGESVERVTEALLRLLTDDRLSTQLGKRAYERTHNEFSWQHVADNTVRML